MKQAMNKKIIISLTAVLLFAAFALAFQYSHYASLLSGGSFNNTLYNTSGQVITLNFTDSTNTSYASNGTYISPVIDLGANTTIKSLTWKGKPRNCPGNMSYIDKFGGYCIDQYEASMPNSNDSAMGNATEITNRNNPGTMPARSKPGVVPWVEVSANSARLACTNAVKHLCTSKEWLGAANIKGIVYNLPATLSALPYNCTLDVNYNFCSKVFNVG